VVETTDCFFGASRRRGTALTVARGGAGKRAGKHFLRVLFMVDGTSVGTATTAPYENELGQHHGE
jgi:hypothetical protein